MRHPRHVLPVMLLLTAIAVPGTVSARAFGQAAPKVASASAPAPALVLGKTPRQIAAMGIVPWTDFYCGEKRWSTATQAQAAAIFGASLRQVNDTRIASLPSTTRKSLTAIRQIATVYSTSLLEIAARDGGSMWVPMRAGVPAAVEELIADLLPTMDRKRAPASPKRSAQVRKLIAATEAGLAEADRTVKQPENAALAIHLRKARASFAQVKKEYARPTWPGSLVILDWYAVRSGNFTPDR